MQKLDIIDKTVVEGILAGKSADSDEEILFAGAGKLFAGSVESQFSTDNCLG